MRLGVRLLLAQGADAATFLAFYLAIGPGTYQEQGGGVLAIMSILGIWGVAGVKVGGSAILARRFLHAPAPSHYAWVRRTRPERWWLPATTIAISVATASGIAGAGFNLASIIGSLQ